MTADERAAGASGSEICGATYETVSAVHLCRLEKGHLYAHHSRQGMLEDFTWANDPDNPWRAQKALRAAGVAAQEPETCECEIVQTCKKCRGW